VQKVTAKMPDYDENLRTISTGRRRSPAGIPLGAALQCFKLNLRLTCAPAVPGNGGSQ